MRHQVRHLRRRGRKVFRAGRGLPKRKVRRGVNKMFMERVYKDLSVEGSHKKEIAKIAVKDPLFYREYVNLNRPKIIVERDFKRKTGNWGQAFSNDNTIKIDKQLFEKPLYDDEGELKQEKSFRTALQSDFPINPRETLSHELQHLKYPNVYDVNIFSEKMLKSVPEPESPELKKAPEEMAYLRSMVDIRKFKKPHYKLTKDIKEGFEGPVLNKTIKKKRSR